MIYWTRHTKRQARVVVIQKAMGDNLATMVAASSVRLALTTSGLDTRLSAVIRFVSYLGAALLLLALALRASAEAQLSPIELGRAHSQCHALRLLLPSAGMDHVAFLERHKRGHFLALSPILGAYKAAVDADYELGYALAAEGRVAQNQLFESYCDNVKELDRSTDAAAPFMLCVNGLRLMVFDPGSISDEFQDFALGVYEDRNCRTLPVPQS